MNEFLNIKQVAELLGVCTVTVTRYCKAGILTYYQIGSRKRFKQEDIDNYLEGGKSHAKDASENPFDIG